MASVKVKASRKISVNMGIGKGFVEVDVHNRVPRVEITMAKPVNGVDADDVMAMIVNAQRPTAYTVYVNKNTYKQANEIFIDREIESLKEQLADLIFVQKIIKKNNVVLVEKDDQGE